MKEISIVIGDLGVTYTPIKTMLKKIYSLLKGFIRSHYSQIDQNEWSYCYQFFHIRLTNSYFTKWIYEATNNLI